MAALLTHPQRPSEDFLSGFSQTPSFRRRLAPSASSVMPELAVGSGGTVYVAVGKSADKTAALLRWTFSMFPGQEVCLLHVHRPSLFIPTLLGKLPASRANPETVAAFRNEEREETKKLLSSYLLTCSRSRVNASIITTEAAEVQKGIINLINLRTIRKLVVGAIPDFMKGKRSSCKACSVSKHAPSCCEIWFVYKGKLVWTRQASSSSSMSLPICQFPASYTHNLRCRSLNSCQTEVEATQTEIRLSIPTQCVESSYDQKNAHDASSSTSLGSSNVRTTCASSLKTKEEGLCVQVAELESEVDKSKDEAYLRLEEQKHHEVDAVETFDKVIALDSAHSHESKLQIDAEDELRLTIKEKERLSEEREKLVQQLEMTRRSITVLDTHAQEANCRHEEVAKELRFIQASMSNLRKEKQTFQSQKIEATRCLARWRSHKQCDDANKNELIGLMGDDVSLLPEFLLLDLEAATCNFSECFRIGRGGYGIVYKGEMLERTVAVKKLHSYNMQRQSEFHNEVQILGKLNHPHLVELIGICTESSLLVYEYLPGGSLQDHFNDTNALNWKARAQIIADISSALLFLHSFRPEKFIHGNLKPGNLLLDSENRCKISDYADSRLTTGLAVRCPSFRGCSRSSGVCLYTDPESYRNGALTHKSDIYAFGVIILQLVTGRTDGGIVGEVRRAYYSGKVASILDSSAGEWHTYVARRLLQLGLQYCQSNSRDRPELTASLVKELKGMPFLEDQTVPSFFLCPILREIMHDPQVASDGFTYEEEAMRGWLGDGHETSPMTNLKLSDTNLTPNHSLRLGIQDWIANLRITS